MEDFGGYDTTGYGETLPQQQVASTPSVTNVDLTAQPAEAPVPLYDARGGAIVPESSGATPAPVFNPAQPAASVDYSQFVPKIAPTATPTVPSPTGVTTYGPDYGKPPTVEAPLAEPGAMDKLKEYLSKNDRLEKLGVGGLQSLAAALMTNRATEQGRAAKQEMQALATPYQQQGAKLSAAAQRGELTPAAQQQMQAVQAQLAQQASSRGGVGAQQSAAQIEAFRNQLLQQQYDYGLKLSGIGDNIALGAIKSGLQADQYVQQLSSNYMNNIMRTLYGVAPQATGTPGQPATAGVQ
jgi:regulator of protease activity HflC (stomatin/prohibitin superfamily)